MAEFANLVLDREGPMARITLDRPQRLNALSPELMHELIAVSEELAANPGTKVIILRGAGRAFSAGFDLDAAADGPVDERADLGRQMAEAFSAIPAITIAAIHGHCVGGALVLAAACDLRIAARDTRFSIPEVDFGIPLAWGGIPRLVRELGPALTKELVLTCRPFGADEARQLRFLNRVSPAARLVDDVEALAASLAAKSALTLTATKQHVNAVAEEMGSTAHAGHDADVLVSAFHDEESRFVGRAYLRARPR